MSIDDNDQTNIFQQLAQYKEQHPDFAEQLYATQEVLAIYRETMQIMKEAELALCPTTIDLSSNTGATK